MGKAAEANFNIIRFSKEHILIQNVALFLAHICYTYLFFLKIDSHF